MATVGGGGSASNHDVQESSSAQSGARVALSNAPTAALGPSASPPVLAVHREPGVYNWQATKSSLKERLSYLLNNELLSDVRFVVGKDRQAQRIPAHKFVLAAGSGVFDAMFNGGMATTTAEIELPDTDPAAFLSLLRWVDETQVAKLCLEGFPIAPFPPLSLAVISRGVAIPSRVEGKQIAKIIIIQLFSRRIQPMHRFKKSC